MKREYRIIRAPEIRTSEDGKSVSGYAAVFNSLSEDLGWFRETIRPGAFAKCLQGDPDVRCLFNHDTNVVLGRTRSGTLDLMEDAKGLKFNCLLPETQAARDVRELIKRGDVSQCSFGFYVVEQEWNEKKLPNGDMECTRELVEVDLFDVSPVTFPAYPATSCEARDLWPDGAPEEIEARKIHPMTEAEAQAIQAKLMGPDAYTETAKRRVRLAQL